MAWTTPRTWVDGETIDASIMNTHVRDNLNAVKTRPSDNYDADEVGDYTTVSATFTDVDAANFALTITTTGGDVLVGFSGNFSHSSAGAYGYLEVDIDSGTNLIGDDGLGTVFVATTDYVLMSFVRLATGLSAGVHTFTLEWKTSAATLTLSAGAATANRDTHPQFWVKEI